MMRTAILLLLLTPSALAASRSTAAGEPARAQARPWRFFVNYDYFLPQNSGDGLKSQLNTQSVKLLAQGYSSTQVSVNTQGGNGARFGVRHPIDSHSDLGLSLGYIVGPTMNGALNADGGPGFGGETVNRTVVYLRYLVEGRFTFPVDDRWTLAMGSGFGLSTGRVEQTCDQSGTVACPVANTRRTWTGFAWEFTPSASYRLKTATIHFGLRYAGFPEFSGNDQIADIDWIAYGAFLGASF